MSGAYLCQQLALFSQRSAWDDRGNFADPTPPQMLTSAEPMIPLRWRITSSQRRSIVTTLFSLTFAGAVVTVGASTLFPCPALAKRKGGDSSLQKPLDGDLHRSVVVIRQPQRWLEERRPGS
jgi:cytochrome c oxidase assembly factor 2